MHLIQNHLAIAYRTEGLPQEQVQNMVSGLTFLDRVTLFMPSPDGITLISDVTTSRFINERPASVRRLVALVIRAARRLGEDLTFEPSGEQLWSRVRARLNDLLLTLYGIGALRGPSAEKAYHVRCDRSTMTQHEIDSGRVIAQVNFAPAAPIEQIDVVLTLNEGGQASLVGIGVEEPAA